MQTCALWLDTAGARRCLGIRWARLPKPQLRLYQLVEPLLPIFPFNQQGLQSYRQNNELALLLNVQDIALIGQDMALIGQDMAPSVAQSLLYLQSTPLNHYIILSSGIFFRA
jgi:hypothetical protein